ncbi:hypothetical protein [Thiomonas sp.]
MEAKDCFDEAPFNARKVARDVHSALAPLGVVLADLDLMVSDAQRLAGACQSHGWKDIEARDLLHEFAADALTRSWAWSAWLGFRFMLLSHGRDTKAVHRIRGCKRLDAPARGDEGLALREVIADLRSARERWQDAELGAGVEAILDWLQTGDPERIAELRGVTKRQARNDVSKLLAKLASGQSLFEDGVDGLDFEAWMRRPSRGGGRKSKAAKAAEAAQAAATSALF